MFSHVFDGDLTRDRDLRRKEGELHRTVFFPFVFFTNDTVQNLRRDLALISDLFVGHAKFRDVRLRLYGNDLINGGERSVKLQILADGCRNLLRLLHFHADRRVRAILQRALLVCTELANDIRGHNHVAVDLARQDQLDLCRQFAGIQQTAGNRLDISVKSDVAIA